MSATKQQLNTILTNVNDVGSSRTLPLSVAAQDVGSKETDIVVTPRYQGSGTAEDPYVVDWDHGDPENPFNWTKRWKWIITAQLAMATFIASFCSSIYSGGVSYTAKDLHVSQEVAILGISLYVLGFCFGPFLWAPLSEIYGRRVVFITTFLIFTLFHLGGAIHGNIESLLATRLLAGMFGVTPFTNSGAALADIWIPRERGVAASLYASAPLMGPVIGPIVGGWVSMSRLGWRFNFWIMFIISGLSTFGFVILCPETYAPTLMQRRVKKLRKESEGRIVYVSKFQVGSKKDPVAMVKKYMGRPFVFLFTEPIVTALAVYTSVSYAILYAFFAGFPIIFQEQRHWSPGIGGLAFIGVGIGTFLGVCLSRVQNILYWRDMARSSTGKAPPESRLYGSMFGGFCLPISLWWFAWTSEPKVFWLVPIIAGTPFGLGVALVIQATTQYLMDAYTIYGASALAGTIFLRSICAAIFPMVTPVIYRRLGDGWACSVFAFLVSGCMPIPFLLFKYGPWLRKHSKWVIHNPAPVPKSAATKEASTIAVEPVESESKAQNSVSPV